jgi:hypothetical protein
VAERRGLPPLRHGSRSESSASEALAAAGLLAEVAGAVGESWRARGFEIDCGFFFLVFEGREMPRASVAAAGSD